jgi:hypothetical protein
MPQVAPPEQMEGGVPERLGQVEQSISNSREALSNRITSAFLCDSGGARLSLADLNSERGYNSYLHRPIVDLCCTTSNARHRSTSMSEKHQWQSR